MTLAWDLDCRDKPGLLWAVLEYLQTCDARISLEGYLQRTAILQHPAADRLQTIGLRRQGQCWPASDFVTLPVTPEVVRMLKVELAGAGAFVNGGWLKHAQIEVHGKVAFGGYDNFHKQCVRAQRPLTEEFLESLVKNGVLVSFKAVA